MKRLLIAVLISTCLYACKSANITTPAANTATKPAVDTALQGDKMKDPTKQ